MTEPLQHAGQSGRSAGQRLLNASGYEGYRETLIESGERPIALSLYESGPQSPCAVFLPGTMTHPLLYDDFQACLARAGWNVAGVHFVSHGKSPRCTRRYTFDELAGNARDAVAWCAAHWNGRIALVGTSQGAMLALAAAGGEPRVKAVVAHAPALPQLAETIRVTRFPNWMSPAWWLLPKLAAGLAVLMPRLPVPLPLYLDPYTITPDIALLEQLAHDPIGLRSYPLGFMASLLSADLSCATDGSLHCPVIVPAARDDAMFPIDYQRLVYDAIRAPHKEWVEFETGSHLLPVAQAAGLAGEVGRRLAAFV